MNRFSAVAAALLLTACGSVPPAPPDQYFRLTAPPAVAVDAAARIQVETFEAHGIQSERPLLFRAGGAGAATQRYRYEFWAEPPSKMLRDTLLDHLRAQYGAERVWTSEARAPADVVVRGHLRAMEQIVEGNAARALLSLEITASDAEGRVLAVSESREEVPAASASVADFVAALDQALARAYAAFDRRLAPVLPGR